VAGLAATFGSGAMTNPIKDVLKAKAILAIGTNTTENHPIFANYVKEAVLKRGAKLIVADPRRIGLVDYAAIWLRHRPGTDVALINGLMHIILHKKALHKKEHIETCTVGFEEFAANLEKYTPEYVSEITGVSVEDLEAAAVIYAESSPASILYAMGITQHTSGTDNVKTLGNLAMLCGNIGVVGGGVNPLRGQNNVQGACDLGALPNVFTGYQKVASEEIRQKFAKAWGLEELSAVPGLQVTQMFPAAEEGTLKGMYIMGENPLVSDPDLHHIEKAVKKLDFMVVQDIFLTETAQLADVVLPGVSFAEKDGTFSNSERKVQRVRKAIEPVGEAREDGWIICQLASAMGYSMEYVDYSRAVMDELRKLTPSYAGISYERLEKKAIAWPCPAEDHPGTPILHVGGYACGKGVFFPIEFRPPAENPDAEYPFILSTGRVLQHFHTGTMTRKGNGLNQLYPELLAEVNPADADKLGVEDGDFVTITSRRGNIKVKAWLTDRPAPGVVFVPFHFGETAVNLLTNAALCPDSGIPEYKVCAVKVEKAS
jgi:formate dehydrogenase alpha subunit